MHKTFLEKINMLEGKILTLAIIKDFTTFEFKSIA